MTRGGGGCGVSIGIGVGVPRGGVPRGVGGGCGVSIGIGVGVPRIHKNQTHSNTTTKSETTTG